jgi:AAA domain
MKRPDVRGRQYDNCRGCGADLTVMDHLDWCTDEYRAADKVWFDGDNWRASSMSNGASARRLNIVGAETLELRPVEWLERDQIPAAALALLASMGGRGKSTIAAGYAARATRGQFDGRYATQPVNVLWVGNEDGREDVIGPRLRVAGTDFRRVGFVDFDSESLGDDVNVVTDIDALRVAIEDYAAKLVIIDPVVEYLPGSTDSHTTT